MANVNGTKKVDTITIKDASNVIVVTNKKSTPYKINKKGKNYIFGNAGKDTIIVKGGKKNYIYGDDKKGKASAIDKITINKGSSNKIYGGNGNDKIFIKGGTNNTIAGGKGNDTFTISGGKNTIISGGAGSDSFIYVKSKKNATVTIKDYKYGENGTGDKFTVRKAEVSGLTRSGKNLTFNVGKGSVTLAKTVDDSVFVNDKRGGYWVYVSGDDPYGSVYLDKEFTGTSFDAGNFKPITDINLNSSEIKKPLTLKGNSNNNNISGGNYDDKLYGKGGNNILYGGSGNDTFVFDTTSKGTNLIQSYNAGDIIAFSDGIGYNSKNVTSSGDVILNLTTGGTINIQGGKGKDIAFDLKNNGQITHQTFS